MAPIGANRFRRPCAGILKEQQGIPAISSVQPTLSNTSTLQVLGCTKKDQTDASTESASSSEASLAETSSDGGSSHSSSTPPAPPSVTWWSILNQERRQDRRRSLPPNCRVFSESRSLSPERRSSLRTPRGLSDSPPVATHLASPRKTVRFEAGCVRTGSSLEGGQPPSGSKSPRHPAIHEVAMARSRNHQPLTELSTFHPQQNPSALDVAVPIPTKLPERHAPDCFEPSCVEDAEAGQHPYTKLGVTEALRQAELARTKVSQMLERRQKPSDATTPRAKSPVSHDKVHASNRPGSIETIDHIPEVLTSDDRKPNTHWRARSGPLSLASHLCHLEVDKNTPTLVLPPPCPCPRVVYSPKTAWVKAAPVPAGDQNVFSGGVRFSTIPANMPYPLGMSSSPPYPIAIDIGGGHRALRQSRGGSIISETAPETHASERNLRATEALEQSTSQCVRTLIAIREKRTVLDEKPDAGACRSTSTSEGPSSYEGSDVLYRTSPLYTALASWTPPRVLGLCPIGTHGSLGARTSNTTDGNVAIVTLEHAANSSTTRLRRSSPSECPGKIASTCDRLRAMELMAAARRASVRFGSSPVSTPRGENRDTIMGTMAREASFREMWLEARRVGQPAATEVRVGSSPVSSPRGENRATMMGTMANETSFGKMWCEPLSRLPPRLAR